jgi:hypothetical protein
VASKLLLRNTTVINGVVSRTALGGSMIGTILLILLIILLLGAMPTWPHSRNWGYYPSGTLGIVLVVVVVMLLMGRI